jgi:ribonuclease ZC3H12
MIKYARDKQGCIMTNDRFNDHIESMNSNVVERERLKEWIRNNCVNYTFIQGELVPNPEFLKSKGLD